VSALNKTTLDEWGGVYVGVLTQARTPTYTGPLLAVDLFSVEPFVKKFYHLNLIVGKAG